VHRHLILVVLVSLLAPLGARGQSPAFEVASVRPSTTGANAPVGASFRNQPGHFVANGATLIDLIAWAHNVRHFQIDGVDDWMRTVKFEIEARYPVTDTIARREVGNMLHALLRERFALVSRVESQESPLYALRVVNARRLGEHLRPSTMNCGRALDGRGVLDPSPLPAASADCQPTQSFSAGPAGAQIRIGQRGIGMEHLASTLTQLEERVVVDGTGLTGRYDFDLTYSPPTTLYITSDGAQRAPQVEGMSLNTALREQLGLRLEATRGQAPVVRIQSAAQPEPN